jgi:hypothetical protein
VKWHIFCEQEAHRIPGIIFTASSAVWLNLNRTTMRHTLHNPIVAGYHTLEIFTTNFNNNPTFRNHY